MTLQTRIMDALRNSPSRVQKIEHDGATVWIKRPEALSGIRRLQKGDPRRGFEAERRGLHALARAGAPVPAILDEGPAHIALADCGTPLDRILTDPEIPPVERRAILAEAGRTLARLHGQGLSHGRPSLKDICWDGRQITLIDVERYDSARNTARGHARDLLMFAFNAHAVARGPAPEIDAALAAYRDAAPPGIWDRAARLARRLRPVAWITAPLRLRRAGKAKEFKAIPATLAAFAADPD